jgi:hypothetical protein
MRQEVRETCPAAGGRCSAYRWPIVSECLGQSSHHGGVEIFERDVVTAIEDGVVAPPK